MQTVLVVDDDPSVRDLICVILQVEGFTVLTARTGEEALTVAATQSVDLVTIDLGLPGMDGWELSRQLRAQPASAHCLQLLVSGDAALDTMADTPGVDAVLAKPFDFAGFAAALHALAAVRPEEHQHPLAELLDQILAERLIEPVFQPVVDLETGCIVGVEGLARGPEGPLQMPGALFDTAHQLGRLHELDALCRIAIINAARAAAPNVPPLVFVNVEPGTVDLPTNDELRSLMAEELPFRVVVEFTERALTRRVPALLRHAEEVRAGGNVVSLDDLGVDARSVAVLPLVRPEIAKLDLSLLAPALSDESVTTAVAVSAYAEQTGAVIVAEGIETEQQRAAALAFGAHWGQGYLLGRPGPIGDLAGRMMQRTAPRLRVAERVEPGATPFDLALSEGLAPRRAPGQVLLGVSRHLELQARKLGDVGVAMVALQSLTKLAEPSAEVYADMARKGAVVGFLGRGMGLSPEPVPGAYGVDLHDADPLARQWVIAILGRHHAGLLVARELPGQGLFGNEQPAEERCYEFIVSHDRDLTAAVARLLTRRITPRSAIPRTTALV